MPASAASGAKYATPTLPSPRTAMESHCEISVVLGASLTTSKIPEGMPASASWGIQVLCVLSMQVESVPQLMTPQFGAATHAWHDVSKHLPGGKTQPKAIHVAPAR